MFLINYFRYRAWLKSPLEDVALTVMDHALQENKEHEFLDFKRDFFTERAFQKDRSNSEQLTKNSITFLLERYSVAFANRYGGFLVVGIAESREGFKLHGINYKNIRRKKLIQFLKEEELRIKNELKINISFISLRVKNREVIIFKIEEGTSKPHLSSNNRYYRRHRDQALDLTAKLSLV